MNSSTAALGIDIAKLKFDVCLINASGKLKHKVFFNNASGFEQLIRWLADTGAAEVHACLEATGTYGEALALRLHEAGCVVRRGQKPATHKRRVKKNRFKKVAVFASRPVTRQ